MPYLLTEQHRKRYEEFQAFAAVNVEPCAGHWDREQRISREVVSRIAECGYLGCTVPAEFDGLGWDTLTFGLLHEALGRVSPALTDVLTVQAMVTSTMLKWGTADQKQRWLAPLARGEMLAAFAITEPGAGSDTNGLSTTFSAREGGLVLSGTKKWISAAQMADVFLVFGNLESRPVACMVPRTAAGVRVEPINDLLGFRAAGLGEVSFEDVRVPASDVVGKPGFALSHIAPVGLHHGRISTACSALGLLRGCVEESARYAASRSIQGRAAGDLGMIRSMIARMGTDLAAGTALCRDACRSEDERLPSAFESAMIAKHFTSRAAVRAASDAVQIHGAAGCHASSPVSRFYRDAKIMEIIEGTTQVHEDMLAGMFVDRAVVRSAT